MRPLRYERLPHLLQNVFRQFPFAFHAQYLGRLFAGQEYQQPVADLRHVLLDHLGLRFVDPAPVTVCLPLGGVDAQKWHKAEDDLSRLQVRQFAFTKLPGHVFLAPDAPGPVTFDVEVALKDASEEIVATMLVTWYAKRT